MPNVTLNGTTFTGGVYTPDTTRKAPQTIVPDPRKIGVLKVSPNGTRIWIQRLNGSTPIVKSTYKLTWNMVPETTRAAVRAIFDLGATFTAILPSGTITVQCEESDYEERPTETLPDGTTYYDITLTLREP